MTSIERETGRVISVVDVAAQFEKIVRERLADLGISQPATVFA